MTPPAKIRWAPRLRPVLLKRLYESDAQGFQDMELCDEVGSYLHARCATFHLVQRGEVACPECRAVFPVKRQGVTPCPTESCDWQTDFEVYWQSIQNHYAFPGRAAAAFEAFHAQYPRAQSYREKMLLIDRLIHNFHIDEATQQPVKSVASKLLEGNKKAVVRFLDQLSGVDPAAQAEWRRTVANTIDGRVIQGQPTDTGQEKDGQ